ncbi:MAG: trypsin-like peptidase domain-containing protein [Clostridia bacterium]|nr:trypsin-like peptidase domain-containing protein [Clostridia bacterium]
MEEKPNENTKEKNTKEKKPVRKTAKNSIKTENVSNNTNTINAMKTDNYQAPSVSNHNFKAVTNPANNRKNPKIKKDYSNEESYNNSKAKIGFGKSILVPFLSGVVGCVAVLGVIFYVPDVKNKIFPPNTTPQISTSISTAPSNSTNSDGKVGEIDLKNYSNTSVYAANKILPSIVGIKVDYTISSNFFMFGSTTAQKANASASGSGIIISEDGYILTNNHIVSTSSNDSFYEISDANKVTVTLYNDKTEYEAKIIGKDEQTDLAVIKIDKTGLTKAEFADSDSIKVGEFAMAVGNPLGMNSSITCGVISAVNREVTDNNGKTYTLIQTDAAINSGNSGGALVNYEGKVIGLNTLKLLGNGVEGMGFAIPINSTKNITEQLIQYSKVKRPYIGISGVDLDEKTAQTYKLVVGVYVKRVENFSSAEKAGLQIGDVITEVEGQKVTTMDKINEIKNAKNIGDELKLKVNRDGKDIDLTVVLGEQP